MTPKKLSNEIASVLAKKNIDYIELMKMSKDMILEQLSIYHEELLFQNDELSRTNVELFQTVSAYQELFHDIPVPILVMDTNGIIKLVNKAAKDFFALSDLKGTELSDFVAADFQDTFYLFLKAIQRNPLETHSALIHLQILNQQKRVLIEANVERGQPEGNYRLVLLDQTERIEFQDQITYLVEHDQLTGVYNRRFFERFVVELETKPASTRIGVIYIDLNNLKLVNDAFGHTVGDGVLKQMTQTLTTVTTPEDRICRLGGDEFVIFIMRPRVSEIRHMIDTIQHEMTQIKVNDLEVSASVGSAIKSNIKQTISSVLHAAEESMYQEKMYASKSGKLKIVGSILSALHGKYAVEERHSNRVAALAFELAKASGYEETDQVRMRSAGLLHDIGKIALNYSILESNRPLTDEEFKEIKKHPEIGYKILLSSRTEPIISEAVLMHHERIDGNGYPRGVKDEDITKPARILAICDSFDAMISDRPYKQPLTIQQAIKELRKHANKQFDFELVEVFIKDVIPTIKPMYEQ